MSFVCYKVAASCRPRTQYFITEAIIADDAQRMVCVVLFEQLGVLC